MSRTGGPDQRHDVEAARILRQPVLFHESECSANNSALFVRADCLCRVPQLAAPTGLHFNEYEQSTFDGYKINFTKAGAFASGHNLVSAAMKPPGRVPFALYAQGGGG